MEFICPVCREPLERGEKTYKCSAGHSYDISKSGSVNLLMSQQSSKKRHGDDRLMVRARRDFLDKGYYSVLRDAACDCAVRYCTGSLLDAGCGEGYYTEAVCGALGSADVFGVDISKAAVEYAAKRCRNASFAVASTYDLPLASNSVSAVMSVFAPLSLSEFARVLSNGGVLIRVTPLEKHLMGLKEQVYDTAYENPPENSGLEGFKLLETVEIRDEITVCGSADIQNLFMMTPYYYKTSACDQAKLASVEELVTGIEFAIHIYKKIKGTD